MASDWPNARYVQREVLDGEEETEGRLFGDGVLAVEDRNFGNIAMCCILALAYLG